jgi:hypothetical protein
MTAARCLAAILLLGCGTPRPPGALAPGDEVALDVESSVSAELSTRPVGSLADRDRDFLRECVGGLAESGVRQGGDAAALAPILILMCPLGAVVADTVVTLARTRPASEDAVLSDAVAEGLAERDLAERFEESLQAELATHFRVISSRGRADGVIHARLDALEVVEYEEGPYALRLDGSARVERSGQRGPDRWQRILVETPKRSYVEWTESGGKLLLADIDSGIAMLARAMAESTMKDQRAR